MATFEGAFSGRPFVLRLNVDPGAQDTAGNYTSISWNLQAIKTANSTPWTNTPASWAVGINGQNWSGNWLYDFRNTPIGGGMTIATGSLNAGHNSDGTKTVSASAQALDPNGLMGNAGLSGNVTLATIARASTSTLSPAGVESGWDMTISTNRASAGFTHNLDYYFGNASGQLATGVTDTFVWSVPHALNNEIPNSLFGYGSIMTTTYSGGAQIGQTFTPFSLSMRADAIPDFVSVSVSEATPGVAANIGGYVQGISKLNISINGATGVYGSTIVSHRIEVAGQTINAASGVTPQAINASGSVIIKATVTDSRGRFTTKEVTVNVLPYNPPQLTAISAYRSLASGVANDAGTSIRVNINAGVKSLIVGTQKNSINYRISTRLRGTTAWTQKALATPTGISFNNQVVVSTYSIEQSFDVLVEVFDDFTTSAMQFTVASAAIFMHWDGKLGVGIGKYREQGALDVAGEIYSNGAKVEPAGSIIMTGRTTAPNGWLLCQGQTVLRADYPTLFTAIGTTYGAGNGTTTFTLPNLQGKFPVGVSVTDASFTVPNTQGGAKSHGHGLSAGFAKHQIDSFTSYVKNVAGGLWTAANQTVGGAISWAGSSAAQSGGIELGGATDQNSNLPPYISLHFIIKT